MITVNNLRVVLSKKTILNNLTFSANRGVLAVLGLNGKGKSSLLKTLAGLIQPAEGKIHFGTTDISTISHKALARHVAFVPQEYSSVFSFTVREMVLMGRTPHIKNLQLPTQSDYAITDRVLDEMGLGRYSDQYFTNLSGGEKRLVLIARALAQQTDILLLDEPTTFLDIKNTFFVLEKIKQLAKEKTIIITLHELNQAVYCADHVLMLFSESQSVCGGIHEVLTEKNLHELYETPMEIVSKNGTIDHIKTKAVATADGRLPASPSSS